MNRKQIFKITGVCAVAGITGLAIWWFWFSGGLGKLDEKDADELFKRSKINNDEENKKEVTGVYFFEYLRKFLKKLDDHAINSACTIEEYNGVDSTNKGDIMKDVVKEVKKILFETDKAKEGIDEILSISDANEIIKDQLEDKETASLALAKLFIYNLLKVPHDESDENYEKYRSNVFEGDYVKKHVGKLDGGLEGPKVKVDTKNGSDTSMNIFKLIYIEMYLVSCEISKKHIKPKTKEEEDLELEYEEKKRELERKKEDALNSLKNIHEGEMRRINGILRIWPKDRENELKNEDARYNNLVKDEERKYKNEIGSLNKEKAEKIKELREKAQ